MHHICTDLTTPLSHICELYVLDPHACEKGVLNLCKYGLCQAFTTFASKNRVLLRVIFWICVHQIKVLEHGGKKLKKPCVQVFYLKKKLVLGSL